MEKFQGSFVGAMRTFFGKDRGEAVQSISQFADELKALTDADKAWFKAEFEKRGWTITERN